MGQTILQGNSDSTKNHFSRETETFLIYSESETVPSTPLRSKSIFLWMFEDKITNSQGQIKTVPPWLSRRDHIYCFDVNHELGSCIFIKLSAWFFFELVKCAWIRIENTADKQIVCVLNGKSAPCVSVSAEVLRDFPNRRQ
jgi:hypothetical protein